MEREGESNIYKENGALKFANAIKLIVSKVEKKTE